MNRGHLRLAYSSSGSHKSSEKSNSASQDNLWNQLDLFSRSETVLFASPETYPFPTLLDLLKHAHVTQIIDLRHIPHFSFEGCSRARFFETLEKLKIGYTSLTAAPDWHSDWESQGSDLINKNIKRGPLMVFSDLEPDRDPDIAIVTNELDKAGVKLERVFVSI